MFRFVEKLIREFSSGSEREDQSISTPIEHYCFALMAITANADSSFDLQEQEEIIRQGHQVYGLEKDVAAQIFREAQQDADASTSLYEFTSEIHKHMSEENKFQLVKGLWLIAKADGHVDKFEEHIIRRIADLIYLSRDRFTEAKHLALQDNK